MNELMQQILAAWGNNGDWNMAGVNRAEELAQLLSQAGVKNLSDLRLEKTSEEYIPEYNEWGELNLNTAAKKTRDGYQLAMGDKRLGYLGNAGEAGSAKDFLELTNSDPTDASKQQIRLGGSGAGDGWTSFNLTPGADGSFSIAPQWGDSGNLDEFLKAATAIAAPVAAWGAGLGTVGLGEAAGAAGGGAAEMVNGAFLGEGVASGVPAWDFAAAKAALGSGALGEAAKYGTSALTSTLAGPNVAGGAAAAGGGTAAAAGGGGGLLGGAAGTGLAKLATIGLGAAAGAEGSDATTATNTRSMDPRIDSRVFGPGGVMELADQQFRANPTGQNATMVQGQNMLRGLLGSPDVAASLTNMARAGEGLMGTRVASNPFANWTPGLMGANDQTHAISQADMPMVQQTPMGGGVGGMQPDPNLSPAALAANSGGKPIPSFLIAAEANSAAPPGKRWNGREWVPIGG